MRPFAKWLLWTSSFATGVTGLVYLWMDRMLEPLNEWAAINHPLQPFVLKAHIIVAPLLVFAIGLIATDHVWRYFRGTIRRARASGLSTTWLIVPMVFSGYLVQAVTHVVWLEVVAWVHITGGALYLAALVSHQVAVRRSRLVTLQLRVRPDLVDETEPTAGVGGSRSSRRPHDENSARSWERRTDSSSGEYMGGTGSRRSSRFTTPSSGSATERTARNDLARTRSASTST